MKENEKGYASELITVPTTRYRIIHRGGFYVSDSSVKPEGGDYGAGLISKAAVITKGEAKTHGEWVDIEMLRQVADAINAEPLGTKSRFTHPNLSGDGLGKALGRFRNAYVSRNIVRADLHFFETAHDTPDGNLADYVLLLAHEDPAAFGTSIAFEPDIDATNEFMLANLDKNGVFRSPDRTNKSNLPHVRLKSLDAVDFVDDPAANPGGLFHRGDQIVFDADATMFYAFGLSEDEPSAAFGVHPTRIRDYVSRFLEHNGFELCARIDVIVCEDDTFNRRYLD